MAGLVAADASAVLHAVSFAYVNTPSLSAAILLAGRTLLGCAESAITTGGVSWGECANAAGAAPHWRRSAPATPWQLSIATVIAAYRRALR